MLDDPLVLFHARQKAGGPPVADLRPGLSPTEINDLVRTMWPEGLVLVDDTILWWWSWQNGVELKPNLPAGSLPVISPDGFTLTGLDRLLTNIEQQIQYHDRRQRAAIFPISTSELGHHFWLTKHDPDDEWTLERDSKDTPLAPPNGDPNSPPIQFTEYLTDIATKSWEELA